MMGEEIGAQSALLSANQPIDDDGFTAQSKVTHVQ